MSKIMLAVLVVIAFSETAVAGYDLAPSPSWRYRQEVMADICHVERCGPWGCRVVNLCRCPARYTCRGLYDAYGPFGGRAFMGAYTRY